ncbi:MAG: arylamine N-acetyltransferase family protein [Myxococcaceae bacterium]
MQTSSLLEPRPRAHPPWGFSVPGSLGDAELTEFLGLLGVRREPPTLPYLRRLQRRCLTTVPFENLDIHWRVPIELNFRHAWEKFVRRRRGGFCYELNGLFGWTLQQLGFDVALLSGRVWRKPARNWGPEYDHLALHVRVGGGDYLVDVGYGDSFRAPLPLPAGTTSDVSGNYRLFPDAGELQLEHATVPGHWRPLYRVSLRPREMAEFAGMLHWHQTSPESPFTNHTVFTLARPWGRSTLTERYRMETRGAHTTRHRFHDRSEWLQELRSRFGVTGPLGPNGN